MNANVHQHYTIQEVLKDAVKLIAYLLRNLMHWKQTTFTLNDLLPNEIFFQFSIRNIFLHYMTNIISKLISNSRITLNTAELKRQLRNYNFHIKQTYKRVAIT